MSIQFEDQSNMTIRRNMYYTPPQGFITSILLKYGLAKTEKRANQIMIVVSILFICIAITLVTINVIKSNTPPKVKYNISKKIFDKLPQNIQISIMK